MLKQKAFRLDTKQDFLPVWTLEGGWGGGVNPVGIGRGLGSWKRANVSFKLKKNREMIRAAQRTKELSQEVVRSMSPQVCKQELGPHFGRL